MAKVIKPIKEKWDEVKKDKNAPIELIQKEDGTGIVKIKRLKTKSRINKKIGIK